MACLQWISVWRKAAVCHCYKTGRTNVLFITCVFFVNWYERNTITENVYSSVPCGSVSVKLARFRALPLENDRKFFRFTKSNVSIV